MLYPTIDELTKGKFNRYELSLAAAKCARIVTDEYCQQKEDAEKANLGSKDSEKPVNTMIDKELRDEKAVRTAIRRIRDEEYVIVRKSEDDEVVETIEEVEEV